MDTPRESKKAHGEAAEEVAVRGNEGMRVRCQPTKSGPFPPPNEFGGATGLFQQVQRPLFERFPGLWEQVPRVSLAQLPSPVQRMERLEHALGLASTRLYIKRDDMNSCVYGGNKARKMEFLLARALHQGRKEVLTIGGAGSNHTLATALFAREVGLNTVTLHIPQPNSHILRTNLLMTHLTGAEMHYLPKVPLLVLDSLFQLLRHRFRHGVFPHVIMPGGSNPTGTLGFVNAALELTQQVETGQLPAPDYLYVACGSMGTSVGLLLGFQVTGLRTHVMAVRIASPHFTTLSGARRQFRAANRFLHRADPSLPRFPFPETSYTLRHDFYGEEYGRYTEAGLRAVRLVQETEGIPLEGTYTGKTVAALLADAQAGLLDKKTVLFWNTCDPHDLTAATQHVDYRALPKPFHRYFEEAVQPLDR